MRYLGADLGDKRTGIAIGDTDPPIVSPLRTIEHPLNPGNQLLDELAKLVDEHKPDALVVGLPLNMDETEGPQAKKVRAFAQRLAHRVNLPIHFQDERLTSDAADWEMARSGLTRGQKKARRDALAAAAFLRDFLASQTPPSP